MNADEIRSTAALIKAEGMIMDRNFWLAVAMNADVEKAKKLALKMNKAIEEGEHTVADILYALRGLMIIIIADEILGGGGDER